MDSHCEATEGWLEPLIDPIARNPNTTTVSVIETINEETFEVQPIPIKNIQLCGLNWNLIYNWMDVPKREIERRAHKTDPIRTPQMVGCLIAINRGYFELLGGFDPGMDVWGGENVE
jgi:polypeptide N-acetylgalactosaminyltransferase